MTEKSNLLDIDLQEELPAIRLHKVGEEVLKTKQPQLPLSIAPKVPKDFITNPIFPAKKQTGQRVVKLRDKKNNLKTYKIGGIHPIDERPTPALDIRHFRVLLCLLSFCEKDKPSRVINLSMNELARRFADNNGGVYNRNLKVLLADLTQCWFTIEQCDSDKRTRDYRILSSVETSSMTPRRKDSKLAKNNQQELWLETVELHEKFYEFLTDVAELARIRLDILNSIKTPIAQTIYSYIPSRAVHHSKDNPFEITASNLLEQLGENIPKEKRDRKKKFAKKRDGRPSIIEQLDGLELVNGTLCVDISETADKTDWKLLFWAEGVSETTQSLPYSSSSQSKLLEAYLASGRGDKKEFDRLMKLKSPLHAYHTDLLEQSGINYHDSMDFLMMVLTIMGLHPQLRAKCLLGYIALRGLGFHRGSR